jgi:hypothetical protein
VEGVVEDMEDMEEDMVEDMGVVAGVEDNTVAESSVEEDSNWEELEQNICWYKYLPCCNNNLIISLGPYSFY